MPLNNENKHAAVRRILSVTYRVIVRVPISRLLAYLIEESPTQCYGGVLLTLPRGGAGWELHRHLGVIGDRHHPSDGLVRDISPTARRRAH
jgi:hypothetical protein